MGIYRRLTLGLVALLIGACGTRPVLAPAPLTPPATPYPLPPSGPQIGPGNPNGSNAFWEPTGEAPYTPRFTTNSARLLVDKEEIFPAMEALLSRAQRLIQIDYYIFSGSQAQRLADILKRKVRQGVRVEMMLDPHLGVLPELRNGSLPVLKDLLAAGVQLKDFPLDRLKRQVGKDSIVDHCKIITIDGREAMTGGMNLADSFANNHDFMVELSGPAAQDLSQNVRHDFLLGDGFKTQQVAGESCEIRVNATGLDRSFNKDAVLAAINGARRSVHVLMFQLTYEDVINALKAAKDRGVDVRVILDPGDHDNLIPIIKKAPRGFPNLPAALELKKAGVQARWYKLKPGMEHMHAKTAVIDGSVAFVGSTNWTTNGFHNNNETSLEIRGGSIPTRLQDVILKDWEQQTEEITDDQSVLSGLKSWLVRKIYFP